MIYQRLKVLCLTLAIIPMTGLVQASDSGGADKKPVNHSAATKPIPAPVAFTQSFSGKFNGKKITYLATAGETYIRDEQGQARASFFTTAYVQKDSKHTTRPVTFIFNGGPGSSAVWLHMGVFGPKRVAIASEPEDDGAPPYPIVDNYETILDVSDLVFIDPIGTGYSRALGDNDPKKHWGLMEDANSISDFIQTWITDNKRWNSPKYIAGESYGTIRAALVADILSSRMISLNGVALISAVLDYQNSRPQDGGILAYAAFLPTMAATAWYHGKINRDGRSLASFIDEVRVFSRTDYTEALIAGNRLSASKRADLVARIAGYTGLSERYVEQSNLRVLANRFYKEFMRKEGLVVGRLDSRYTSVEPSGVGDFVEADPSITAIGSAFTSAINSYFAETLGVKMLRPYKVFGGHALSKDWNWLLGEKPPNGGRFVNVVPHLGRAMRHNKDLRVLLASGYYDFATPFFGAENALAEDGVVPERIEYTYYESGHMMYLDKASRIQFLKDIRKFITN